MKIEEINSYTQKAIQLIQEIGNDLLEFIPYIQRDVLDKVKETNSSNYNDIEGQVLKDFVSVIINKVTLDSYAVESMSKDELVIVLSALWGESLRLTHNWSWEEDDETTFIVSPSGYFCIQPEESLRKFLNNELDNTTAASYDEDYLIEQLGKPENSDRPALIEN
jgi:hypothetical protein